jgi:uncharacterized protein
MLEHLRLTQREDAFTADGVIVGAWEGRALRLRYEVRCDAGWRARSVRVGSLDSGVPEVALVSDGEGNWETRDGRDVPGLQGCTDVDISATPFTNTLPIRRLGLAPGESADVSVVYISADELRAWPEPQRYTCLEKRPDGGLYRFEALDGGFVADLPVDADGLVLDYPSLFRRAFSG